MAPGSLHPTGALYRLYAPHSGQDAGLVLPSRDDLPALPEPWLSLHYRKPRTRGTPATTEEDEDFANTYTFDEHPYMLRKTVADVRQATGDSETRNACLKALGIAARKARAGCYPWQRARDAIEAAAIAAYAERGRELDENDFAAMVNFVVTEALDMTAAEIGAWGGEREPVTVTARRPRPPRFAPSAPRTRPRMKGRR
jgi:hypothetical protein